MTTATKRIELGTAALAMAAAAVISPAVAQADSFAPAAPSLTSFSETLGGTAGSAVCGPFKQNCSETVASAKAVSNRCGSGCGIFITAWIIPLKNNPVWNGNLVYTRDGKQNESYWKDSATEIQWEYAPLDNILWLKPFIPGLWKWWEARSSQTCVLGLSTRLGGPYGKPGVYTRAYNPKGCNP